jgi:hypothetical protein
MVSGREDDWGEGASQSGRGGSRLRRAALGGGSPTTLLSLQQPSAELVGVSPDGRQLIILAVRGRSNLLLVDGLPAVTR